ncbi:MAG: serine hydrolase domain-containing protein [Rhodothermales bacterium]
MKNVMLGGCLVLLVAGCSGSGGPVLDEATRFQAMTQDIQIDGASGVSIDEALEHHGADGATVVVFEDGVPTLLRGHYGYQDRAAGIETDGQTIYQAASLSKFVAGLGMVKGARLHGEFGLGRKVSDTASGHAGSLVSVWVNVQGIQGVAAVAATQMISIRRLLKNAAGLNRPTTGTECSHPSATTGLDDLLTPIGSDPVEIVGTPGTKWKYSSGGFALAEAMLLAETGRNGEEFLETEILEPFGMDESTFADASASMDHLARGCDSEPCACEVEYAEVKFPGGLLAHPVEYAAFLREVMNVSVDGVGRGGLTADDLHEALRPAQHATLSSNASCTSDAGCPPLPILGSINPICHTGTCIQPLETGNEENSGGEAGGWYGTGVHLSPDRDVGGYSRTLHHLGGQDGVTTYFSVDRSLKNGIVIMINGGPKAGRKALRADIFDAFERHFR